jgi:hypothetical protein
MITISARTLIRKVQSEIVAVQKLEPRTFKEKIDKARTVGYLASVAGQLLEKHDYSEKLEELLNLAEGLKEERKQAIA